MESLYLHLRIGCRAISTMPCAHFLFHSFSPPKKFRSALSGMIRARPTKLNLKDSRPAEISHPPYVCDRFPSWRTHLDLAAYRVCRLEGPDLRSADVAPRRHAAHPAYNHNVRCLPKMPPKSATFLGPVTVPVVRTIHRIMMKAFR